MDAQTKINKITHLQFMQAVDALRKHKQEFLDRRPDHTGTAKRLGELCGFVINRGTAAKIKKASGVGWESRRGRSGRERFSSFNAVGTLARAVAALYERLGETPSNGLAKLIERYNRKPAGGRPETEE